MENLFLAYNVYRPYVLTKTIIHTPLLSNSEFQNLLYASILQKPTQALLCTFMQYCFPKYVRC